MRADSGASTMARRVGPGSGVRLVDSRCRRFRLTPFFG